MARVALGLAYDGAGWHGWQTQPGGRTVQDTVERALQSFLNEPVNTICAGRTDTGVHALEQVLHLDTTVQRRAESWVRGVNAFLPPSIRIQWACEVADDFHARYSAMARSYFYVLRSSRVATPILHGKVGWTHRPLDLKAMQAAAKEVLGEHDFSAFRSSECQAASPVRSMHSLEVMQAGDFYLFHFRANAFLHHMVRNLMGALVEVGQGKREAQWMAELLQHRDRRLASATFPAAGLYLAKAEYPPSFGLPSMPVEEALATHLGLRVEHFSA